MYPNKLINFAKQLRQEGLTYQEISTKLKTVIPKSTYSSWFKNLKLSSEALDRISKTNKKNITMAQHKAVIANAQTMRDYRNRLDKDNSSTALAINVDHVDKIALAILCLGEASKYGSGSSFYLGNSDPRIIKLFISLLYRCYNIDASKFRCTIQCRNDQDIQKLESFWQNITHIPKSQFYKTRIDKRTINKPTKKVGYMGVLKVDYFDTHIQHDLESLANLIYNTVCSDPKM